MTALMTIPPIMPYSMVIGQDMVKLALELAYIAPRIGGVLISGNRGTGKSTAVRAFAQMVYRRPLVTLPINATEDRVVGGWQIDKLMRGRPVPQQGLLREADNSVLYVDEVNLLDDHIVNIILDVASTGILSVQREGLREEHCVRFILVGTMNPEEGLLRPQLLDRFGLMVHVEAESDATLRAAIIQSVITYDAALAGESGAIARVARHIKSDAARARKLEQARTRFLKTTVSAKTVAACVRVATAFKKMQGHRGDLVMLTAARAYAARAGKLETRPEHLAAVAQLAIQHRRAGESQGTQAFWRKPGELAPDDPGDDALVLAQIKGEDG